MLKYHCPKCGTPAVIHLDGQKATLTCPTCGTVFYDKVSMDEALEHQLASEDWIPED